MKYLTDEQIQKIRDGYYSAVYFNRTKEILLGEKNMSVVTMQVFQKQDNSILCGIEEMKELFSHATGYWDNHKWIDTHKKLIIETLEEGDTLSAWNPVMHITGPYVYFAHLESLYLGILARRTLVASNTAQVVKAANHKWVIFFADRFDYFLNQTGDGYAAHLGGVSGVCTEAHAAWWGGSPVGTLPHALIAVNGGNTVEAAKQFSRYYGDVNLIALVDFENDCVKTALEVARAMGKKLWGVRIDTAENMTDESLEVQSSKIKIKNTNSKIKSSYNTLNGVNPTLVKLVRTALDQEGFPYVKIVVSGGFDADKVAWFEKEKAPVDVYGVGSALLKGNNDFTADIVRVDGKDVAKAGREYRKLR